VPEDRENCILPIGMGIYLLRSVMRKSKLILTLSFVALCFANGNSHGAQQAAQPAPRRHRIAVLAFSDATADSASQTVFGTQVDFAQGITQLLIARLVSDGAYQVIADRDQIQRVLTAQNVSSREVADPKTAAKIGHAMRADAVVVGQVTQFGWDASGGNPESTPARSSPPKNATGPTARKAVVVITAEIIDANTGQTLATANSKGVSRRSGTKLLDSAASGALPGNLTMDSSTFEQSMIGEATTAAVEQMAKELEGENSILPTWAPPPPRGQITSASSPNIIINVGSNAGLKVGDQMLVSRIVHVEKDRVTDAAVGAIEDEVGVLTITSVEDDSATGTFSGAVAPKVGDQVRPLQ
jgi:curli biogenesis system outer membrane secretion channel CsgG